MKCDLQKLNISGLSFDEDSTKLPIDVFWHRFRLPGIIRKLLLDAQDKNEYSEYILYKDWFVVGYVKRTYDSACTETFKLFHLL